MGLILIVGLTACSEFQSGSEQIGLLSLSEGDLSFTSNGAGQMGTSEMETVNQEIEMDEMNELEMEDQEDLDLTLVNCPNIKVAAGSWPPSFKQRERQAFLLAANITGSFEGRSGWTNLANNFDGQGFSAGLFNQNLGQGSLQPMLLNTRKLKPGIFDKHFSKDQKKLIYEMLDEWEGRGLSGQAKASLGLYSYSGLFSEQSDLDNQSSINQKISTKLIPKNQVSVDWAVKNLYIDNGRTFKSEWKSSIMNFLKDEFYVSEQIKAATVIHNRALRYTRIYSTEELRSYLYFFDIVVQNGSIQSSVQKKYEAVLEEMPSGISEYEKMKLLLELRLELVRDRFVEDVRSRKMSILDGKGIVHRTRRNFPEEFCVENWSRPF